MPEGLFVALVGARTDGHDHARGAHAVLGSRPTEAPTVVVRDPVVALARLAAHVVGTVRPTVLAVTGSHGKTSTKELLSAALPGAVATEGNLNNELGVPLTCLRLTAADDQLVLEDGNHRTEGLRRAGEDEAWCIVSFESPAERDHFLERAGQLST